MLKVNTLYGASITVENIYTSNGNILYSFMAYLEVCEVGDPTLRNKRFIGVIGRSFVFASMIFNPGLWSGLFWSIHSLTLTPA